MRTEIGQGKQQFWDDFDEYFSAVDRQGESHSASRTCPKAQPAR
jgi:hypothetical protein